MWIEEEFDNHLVGPRPGPGTVDTDRREDKDLPDDDRRDHEERDGDDDD